MGHFFEERAADVFARLVAVHVLLTELYVLERGAAQTVQGVGEEELALLRCVSNVHSGSPDFFFLVTNKLL